MDTCRCGGLLMETWEHCKFCGAPVGGAPPPEPAAAAVPPAPATTPQAGPGRKSIVALIVAAVALIGALGAAALGGDQANDPSPSEVALQQGAIDDETTTTAAPTLSERVAAFCRGDRQGIPDALAYDGAPGRTHLAFQTDNTNSKVDGWTYISGDADQVELVVCSDQIPGTSRDGKRCDDYGNGLIVQTVVIDYEVRVYAVRTGEVLASGRVAATDACPFDLLYNRDDVGADGVLRYTQSPHFGRVREIAEPFVFPS